MHRPAKEAAGNIPPQDIQTANYALELDFQDRYHDFCITIHITPTPAVTNGHNACLSVTVR